MATTTLNRQVRIILESKEQSWWIESFYKDTSTDAKMPAVVFLLTTDWKKKRLALSLTFHFARFPSFFFFWFITLHSKSLCLAPSPFFFFFLPKNYLKLSFSFPSPFLFSLFFFFFLSSFHRILNSLHSLISHHHQSQIIQNGRYVIVFFVAPLGLWLVLCCFSAFFGWGGGYHLLISIFLFVHLSSLSTQIINRISKTTQCYRNCYPWPELTALDNGSGIGGVAGFIFWFCFDVVSSFFLRCFFLKMPRLYFLWWNCPNQWKIVSHHHHCHIRDVLLTRLS